MRAAVVGLGNVGTTLTQLLAAHREPLGLTHLLAIKNYPTPWTEADLGFVSRCTDEVLVTEDASARWAALADIDVIFDCRREGAALADRDKYLALSRARCVVAQGSEHGFGVPFIVGMNDDVLAKQEDKTRCVQVMSCNTHGSASLLRACAGGTSLAGIVHADFVVVRRSEDIGAQGRLVGANVVARHRESATGTHHSADALRVFRTLGLEPSISSSDVTTPSQLLHAVRFAFTFDQPVSEVQIRSRLEQDPWIATTEKFDSNRVFELGRRYGFQGRLYAHAIAVANNLLVRGNQVFGWAFVPQEGNTLLSTVAAYLHTTGAGEAPALAVRHIREQVVLRKL